MYGDWLMASKNDNNNDDEKIAIDPLESAGRKGACWKVPSSSLVF